MRPPPATVVADVLDDARQRPRHVGWIQQPALDPVPTEPGERDVMADHPAEPGLHPVEDRIEVVLTGLGERAFPERVEAGCVRRLGPVVAELVERQVGEHAGSPQVWGT
jgi:hypothetical protein